MLGNEHPDSDTLSGIHNLAALVADVDTGEVLAYAGNVPEFGRAEHGNFVDIVQAPRSTGSLLKPLLYEAMLEAGAYVHWFEAQGTERAELEGAFEALRGQLMEYEALMG